jgi:hypothetical protein
MKPILNARQSSPLQSQQPANTLGSHFDVTLPSIPTTQQKQWMSIVKFLGSGAERFKKINADSVLLNFELMAFAISWFGLVSRS